MEFNQNHKSSKGKEEEEEGEEEEEEAEEEEVMLCRKKLNSWSNGIGVNKAISRYK